MYLRFDVENLKNDLFCMENDFLLNVEDDDLYSKVGILKIYFSEDGEEETFKLAGCFEFHAFNVTALFNHHNPDSRLFFAMEKESQDQIFYYNVFLKAFKNLKKTLNEDFMLDEILCFTSEKYVITVDDFCIVDEFRRKGIAKYVLDNLSSIFQHYFNITPITAVGLLKPHKNEPENMLEIQKKCYKKSGFTIYKGEEYFFYKNYIPKF